MSRSCEKNPKDGEDWDQCFRFGNKERLWWFNSSWVYASSVQIPAGQMSRRALALTVTTQVSRYRKQLNFGC